MLQALWIPPGYKPKNKPPATVNIVTDAASVSDLSSGGDIGLTAQHWFQC